MMPTASVAAVEVHDLRIELTRTRASVVDEIEMKVSPGEVLGLVGESGCGKTTLGLALLGHVRPGCRVTRGEVLIGGRGLTEMTSGELRALRGRRISYIPQDPATALNPALRIATQLHEVLRRHLRDLSDSQRLARAQQTLREVALPGERAFLRRYPHQLSGGQQQRMAIAMAFACRPDVIVCDEPTTGLDVTTQRHVLETIRALCASHRVASLYVSHDLSVVAELADRVAVMYGGRIVESGPRERLFSDPSHPYTRGLLMAVPRLSGPRKLTGIPGRAPPPGSRPQGCSFHPRCPLATGECRDAFPQTTDRGDGSMVRCHHATESWQVGTPAPGGARESAAGGEPVLLVRGLNAQHDNHQALFEIDLEVAPGGCTALVGESGSGKTTLARCIAGLHRNYNGEVSLGGSVLPRVARKRSPQVRKQIQYVFQNPYASLNPRRTVGQAIARQLTLFFSLSRQQASHAVANCLERVMLPTATAARYPDELSGGERQRAAIARAIAAEPSVLICDEVTSSLDVSVQAAIVGLLLELRDQAELALLFITHNIAVTRTVADRVAVMRAGRIVERGNVTDIYTSPANAYARRLLADTPDAPSLATGSTGSTSCPGDRTTIQQGARR